MPQRISLKEQYDNRDVIAQIYRLIALVESSTIVRTTSVQEGSTVTVTFDMYDGTSKSFTFTNNADMTTDTEQNVTALKNFLAGLNVTGNTQIDGDTQIVNGHSLQVAGDLDVAGDTEVAGKLTVHGQSEISGMAIEESSGETVMSNANGIKSASPVTLSDLVVPTTVTGQRDARAVNGERLQNDLDAYAPMVRTSGNQRIAGTNEFYQITLLNNFRPFIFYGDYSPESEAYDFRVRPITIFAGPDATTNPIMRMETRDTNNSIALDISVTDYEANISKYLILKIDKTTGKGIVTAPSRDSTNISDYGNDEVVTIRTLRNIGVI